jgi:flagellar basal-body rod protein FlgB
MQLFDTTFVALERAIAGSALRHEVLASNIANANTPGYQRQDVDFHSALEAALRGNASTGAIGAIGFEATADGSGPVRVDGSSVDVEREMASLVQNAQEHQALLATLRAHQRILTTVIGGRV